MITRATLFERFAGRDEELRYLVDLRARSSRELRGGTVLISGSAGIGKSRLLTEFGIAPAPARWTLVRVRCDEFGASYGAFVWAFEELSAQRELRDSAEIARALALLRTGDIERNDDSQRQRVRKDAIIDAVRYAARRLGQLTLVFDDAHWSDRSSLEAMRAVSSAARDQPLLSVIAYRPDDIASDHARASAITAIEREGADRITLEPLTFGDLSGLLHNVLPGASSGSLRRIYALSEGRPYVAEELARNVVERGGDFEFEPTLTLRSAVLERVSQLSPHARTIIDRAAVLGRNFMPADLLALGSTKEQTIEALREALHLQLVEERDVAGEAWFRFRHALTREILYKNLLVMERRSVHAEIADHLSHEVARAAELAYHLSAAGETSRAIVANERAGDEAAGLAAFADAAECFGRALGMVSDPETLARLAIKRAESLRKAGELEELFSMSERDAQRLEHASLHDAALSLRLVATGAAYNTRFADARRLLDRVESSLRPDSAPALRFEFELLKARILRHLFRIEESLEACDRAAAALPQPTTHQRSLVARSRAWTYLSINDLPNALAGLELYLSEARTDGEDTIDESAVGAMMADISYRRGAIRSAFEQRLELAAAAAQSGRLHAALIDRQTAAYYAGEIGEFAYITELDEEYHRERNEVTENLIAARWRVARATGNCPHSPFEPFERALESGGLFLIEKLGRDLPWILADDRAQARTIVRRALDAMTSDGLEGDFVQTAIEFGTDDDIAAAMRVYERPGPPNEDQLVLCVFDAMVRARLALREHRTLEAAEHARRAAEGARRTGQWLQLAHALHILEDRQGARHELLRVGAVAELERLERKTVAKANPPTQFDVQLTPREEQIARLISSGLTSRETAQRLAIAPRTVETHLANAYLKLGIGSRAELIERLAGR